MIYILHVVRIYTSCTHKHTQKPFTHSHIHPTSCAHRELLHCHSMAHAYTHTVHIGIAHPYQCTLNTPEQFCHLHTHTNTTSSLVLNNWIAVAMLQTAASSIYAHTFLQLSFKKLQRCFLLAVHKALTHIAFYWFSLFPPFLTPILQIHICITDTHSSTHWT